MTHPFGTSYRAADLLALLQEQNAASCLGRSPGGHGTPRSRADDYHIINRTEDA